MVPYDDSELETERSSSPLSSVPSSIFRDSPRSSAAPEEQQPITTIEPPPTQRRTRQQDKMETAPTYTDSARSETTSPPDRQNLKKRVLPNAFPKLANVTAPKKRKRPDKRWESEFLLTNEKSPLVHADLRAILCHPTAWSSLNPADQQEILALLPDNQHILDASTAQARPNIESLLNDDNFRHDCARYTEDLGKGLHDKEWLEQAWEAYEMRNAGFFDDYQIQDFEESWGVPLPEELKAASVKAAAPTAVQGATAASSDELADGGELEKSAKLDDDGGNVMDEVRINRGTGNATSKETATRGETVGNHPARGGDGAALIDKDSQKSIEFTSSGKRARVENEMGEAKSKSGALMKEAMVVVAGISHRAGSPQREQPADN